MAAEEATVRRGGRVGRVLVIALVLAVLVGALWTWFCALVGVFRRRARRRAAEVLAQGLDLQDLRRRAGAVRRRRRGAADLVLQHARREAREAAFSPAVGDQIRLHYTEHRGVPTSCFAETPYFAESFTRRRSAERRGRIMTTVNDFEARTLEGKPVALRDYQGKVLLIVNTASKCGFTPQYQGLEELYRKYQDRGLVVLGFPCNQFLVPGAGQRRGDRRFCERNYGVSFPMFEKIDVNGPASASAVSLAEGARSAACSARNGSSGTSRNSCSIARAMRSAATRPARSRKHSQRISRRCCDGHRASARRAPLRVRASRSRCGRRRRRPRKNRSGSSGSAPAQSRSLTIAARTRCRCYPVPVPYFVYRGPFLKADRDGLRGELFDRKVRRAEPQRQRDDSGGQREQCRAPRHAGPEPTLELGPSLEVHLWRSADEAREARPGDAAARARHARELAAVVALDFLAAAEHRYRRRRRACRLGFRRGRRAGLRRRPVPRVLLFRAGAFATQERPRVPRRRRLLGHACARRAVEAIPEVLGRRVRALRLAWQRASSRTAR